MSYPRWILGLLLLVVFWAAPCVAGQEEPVSIGYRIAIADHAKQMYRVDMHVRGTSGGHVDLTMPSWQPASYAIQNYAKAVSDAAARTAGGSRLDVDRRGQATWRVSTGDEREFTFSYLLDVSERQKLYSRSYLHDRTGAIQAGGALPYLPAYRDASVSVTFDLPADWQVATAMEGGPRTFKAADYDELVDSPILFGDLVRRDFTVRGIPFAVVLDKRIPYDPDKLAASITAVAEAQIAFFGDAPFDRFLFLYLLTTDPSGNGEISSAVGIEHLRSTLITISPFLTTVPTSFDLVMAEVNAHELFHAWNVKAIRPEQLDRPDYTAPPRVRSLWLLEGVTSYYTHRFLAVAGGPDARAGETMLRGQLASALRTVEAGSGKSIESIALSLPEEGLDQMLAIYYRGEALGLLLDLHIRLASGNAAGLDDAMRDLYRRSRRGATPYKENDLPALFNQSTGVDVSEFFTRHIAGREDFHSSRLLSQAGFALGIDTATGAAGMLLTSQPVLSRQQQQIQSAILKIKGRE